MSLDTETPSLQSQYLLISRCLMRSTAGDSLIGRTYFVNGATGLLGNNLVRAFRVETC